MTGNVLIRFAVQLSDKSSPVIHILQLRKISRDSDSTFNELFQQLSHDKTFESSSFDITNKYLQSIEISGTRHGYCEELVVLVSDLDSKQVLYYNQFLSVQQLKFIFRLRTLSSPKIFNCPIHGHIKYDMKTITDCLAFLAYRVNSSRYLCNCALQFSNSL